MAAGLAITAATAWLIAGSPAVLRAIATGRLLFWLLIGGQFGIVIALSARVEKMAASTASLLFAVYSALTGVTMSFVLMAYTANQWPTRSWSRQGCWRTRRVWDGDAPQSRGNGSSSSWD